MSLHIYYDHQCKSCGAYFIPFKENYPCPKCGEIVKETFDLISEAVISAKFQYEQFGCFTPIAWWNASFADHVILHIFRYLDKWVFKDKKCNKNFDEILVEAIDATQFGDFEYAKPHLFDMTKAVYKEILEKKILKERA